MLGMRWYMATALECGGGRSVDRGLLANGSDVVAGRRWWLNDGSDVAECRQGSPANGSGG